jgi:hypothetical protein
MGSLPRYRKLFANIFCPNHRSMPDRESVVAWRNLLSTIVISAATVLASCGGGGTTGGGPKPGTLILNVSPSAFTLLPSSSITLEVTASESNTTATPTVTISGLPTGLTAGGTFPLTIPTGGTSITLQSAATIAAGTYSVMVNGQAGSATTAIPVNVTVQTQNLPAFYFTSALYKEIAIPAGGSSQIQVDTGTNGTATFEVALAVSGLPVGTAATVLPNPILPGNAATITISAAANAPSSQNLNVTVTGTPDAPISAATTTFLASVTPAQNILPNNRTDYLSTEGSPFAAAYDSVHKLIFSSNNSWNRVDVISDATHAIVKSIPVRDPRGIDVSVDSTRVWVATGSQQVFEISTTTFAATRHFLPGLGPTTPTGAQIWQGNALFALADGTVLMYTALSSNTFSWFSIWDPVGNTLTPLRTPSASSPGVVFRSGDGKKVFCGAEDSSGTVFFYDVMSKTFEAQGHLAGYGSQGAANADGSRLAIGDSSGLNMYDGNFNLIGPLGPAGDGGALFPGGLVFSATNGNLYILSMPIDIPVVFTIDPNSLNVLSVAPAMGMIPLMDELVPPFFLAVPFGVDETGLVLGVQYYGIAFDDATFNQNFVTNQPGTPTFLQHMSPYEGPITGGTTSAGFGNSFNITPDIWYGANRGIATNTSNDLEITSPPGSAPGPVNLKFLFPDGIETFDPLFFSYGPFLETAPISGAPPEGGVAGQVAGFGLPANSSGGTITVNGSAGAITQAGTISSQYGYPFPANVDTFTIPAGAPGRADITVNTPDGTSTLPQAMFYAQSVTDYASADTFNSILYDNTRQQLYLSAGDHIDVFSLSSNQFLSPIAPTAQGSSKQFAGMALTPDGSSLLIADVSDGSLAVVNLSSPSSSYAIPVVAATTPPGTNCTFGPLSVAATVNNQAAYVLAGGLPYPACGDGSAFQVNLSTRTANFANLGPACSSGGNSIGSTDDGTKVLLAGGGLCIYNVMQNTSLGSPFILANGAAISGDGMVAASHDGLFDGSANLVGQIARPDVLYGEVTPDLQALFQLLPHPRLNDSGSLYYVGYPTFIDIIDVEHGTLRIRFSLSETVLSAVNPLAIDSGGRYIFLITNRGLTVVDLGAAPLSIGSLTPATASSGTQVVVRGSGFTNATTVTVGGQAASVVFTDENTLTITVPALPSGPADIVITTGSATYTLENGLQIS